MTIDGYKKEAVRDYQFGRGPWLISKASDFLFACAGAGLVPVAMAAALRWHGDREFDVADLLLSELHLGATYGAILRTRLWRPMPWSLVAAPLAILIATYVLVLGGHSILITTAILYLAAWHRVRQNFGLARFYQTQRHESPSLRHKALFRAAIYLPMISGVMFFNGSSALCEGDEYIAFSVDANFLYALGTITLLSIASYLVFAMRHRRDIHPGEVWLMLTNAISFGSAYVLGARHVSFILILAVHHEIQYLYFTYAMARRSVQQRRPAIDELRLFGSFAVWPLIGLGSWAVCQSSHSEWVPPFLIGGLLCHYWFDARIWTSRAKRLASA